MESSKYKYRYPRIVLKMTDKDIVSKAATIMGNTDIRAVDMVKEQANKEYKSKLKQSYVTEAGGKRAAGWMMTLYSLMGERRQNKIHEILTEWNAINASARQAA